MYYALCIMHYELICMHTEKSKHLIMHYALNIVH